MSSFNTKEILKEVRELEYFLWLFWNKSAAPLLILCLDIKISLSGFYTRGRLIKKIQFLIWQGFQKEAAMLLQTISHQRFSHKQRQRIKKLEKSVKQSQKNYKLEPLQDFQKIQQLTQSMCKLHSLLKKTSLHYCLKLFGQIECTITPLLSVPSYNGKVSCSRHPTEVLFCISASYPHRENNFKTTNTLCCSICGREKVLMQKSSGILEIKSKPEFYFYVKKLCIHLRKVDWTSWLGLPK